LLELKLDLHAAVRGHAGDLLFAGFDAFAVGDRVFLAKPFQAEHTHRNADLVGQVGLGSFRAFLGQLLVIFVATDFVCITDDVHFDDLRRMLNGIHDLIEFGLGFFSQRGFVETEINSQFFTLELAYGLHRHSSLRHGCHWLLYGLRRCLAARVVRRTPFGLHAGAEAFVSYRLVARADNDLLGVRSQGCIRKSEHECAQDDRFFHSSLHIYLQVNSGRDDMGFPYSRQALYQRTGKVTTVLYGNAMEWKISKKPVDYNLAVAFMEKRVQAIRVGTEQDLVWLLEHPPLYTAGTSAKDSDLLDGRKFPVHKTGRGGQYTYHGPGQRVAYVMLDLKKRTPDVRMFVRSLEDWIITTLADFGVKGCTYKGRVGVWVKKDGAEVKIAAIGVRLRQWVTYHGIAINVHPDLSHYSGIIPCGMKDYGVTSLADLGIQVTMNTFDERLVKSFNRIF